MEKHHMNVSSFGNTDLDQQRNKQQNIRFLKTYVEHKGKSSPNVTSSNHRYFAQEEKEQQSVALFNQAFLESIGMRHLNVTLLHNTHSIKQKKEKENATRNRHMYVERKGKYRLNVTSPYQGDKHQDITQLQKAHVKQNGYSHLYVEPSFHIYSGRNRKEYQNVTRLNHTLAEQKDKYYKNAPSLHNESFRVSLRQFTTEDSVNDQNLKWRVPKQHNDDNDLSDVPQGSGRYAEPRGFQEKRGDDVGVSDNDRDNDGDTQHASQNHSYDEQRGYYNTRPFSEVRGHTPNITLNGIDGRHGEIREQEERSLFAPSLYVSNDKQVYDDSRSFTESSSHLHDTTLSRFPDFEDETRVHHEKLFVTPYGRYERRYDDIALFTEIIGYDDDLTIREHEDLDDAKQGHDEKHPFINSHGRYAKPRRDDLHPFTEQVDQDDDIILNELVK
ncbi:hypothetical protein KIN20_026245 [Parelaphostrongylus tenuis]|uniref:Uncharacterized protein n=1 Tax=Parelaphostrongylus tenuis TaxID=148309 RepID=A0AAD5N0F1_PARTN|nr:hypothetical protein KIN20_026245 [Parelaphostrongylus tenuis]